MAAGSGSWDVADREIETAREQSERGSEEDGGGKPKYEDGFSFRVVIGAIFVCLIMLPGAIYLGLVAGQGLGGSAQWVTIVLFSEVARRSFITLKRQEIYCLYYMAGALTLTGFSVLPGISGGPVGGLIGMQYLMQSPYMHNVAVQLPSWVAPHLGSAAYQNRNLLDHAWYVPFFWSPLPILIFTQVFDRLKWVSLGYILFRITSDVERLPFPMATVAASGATALAEAGTKEESWRWRIFSTGTIIGLLFGAVYIGVPVISGIFLQTPVQILPIPFFDFTTNAERALPTALIGYNPDLGAVMIGFVLPFEVVLGSFLSSVIAQIGVNPILQHYGMFPHWLAGSAAIQTSIAINFDFWMSFNIGTQLAVAIIGFGSVFHSIAKSRSSQNKVQRGSLGKVPEGRGDFPIWVAVAVWLTATVGYVLVNHKLVPMFPLWIIAFYGLIWTPLNSYVTARMIALTGQSTDVPFVNQSVVLASHYSKPDIWFAPLPLNNYGSQAQSFRQLELTGTKITSLIKLEAFMLPIILITSFAYWAFLWKTNDIPSAQFPYVQKFWPQAAVTQSVWSQINAHGGTAWATQAIKPKLIEMGGVIGLGLYAIMMVFKAPLLFFYGFIGGIGTMPHFTIPTFLGGVLGKFYFSKKIGKEKWQLYTPVLLAGFSCGVGLLSMAVIALALIAKTVNFLPF